MKMNEHYLPETKQKEEFYYLLNQPRSESILVLPENKLNSKADELEYYLSTCPKGVNLIIAPTGIGKTYWAREKVLSGQYKYILIIAPTRLIVEEITKDLMAASSLIISDQLLEIGLVNLVNQKMTVVVTTYHHAVKHRKYLPEVDLLIVDEAHWIHEYEFTHQGIVQSVGWHMLQVIKKLRYNTHVIMLTASPEVFVNFPEWFFIQQIIYINQPKKPVLPKKIYIYPSSGFISSLQYLRDGFKRLVEKVDDENKVLIFQDGGIKRTAHIHYIQNAVLDSNIDEKAINVCKSENRNQNQAIQSILDNHLLDDPTQVFIVSSFAATGINVKDEKVKNVFVLSDRMTFIQQASARLRAYKQANLILFQQPNYKEQDIITPLPEEINQAMKHKIKTNELTKGLDIGFMGRWEENFDGELDFNPIPTLQKWLSNKERSECSNLGKLVKALEKMYESVEPPEIEIINERFIQCQLNEDRVKHLPEMTGYDGMKNKKGRIINWQDIQKELEVVVEKNEVKLYTERQLRKILGEKFVIGTTVGKKRDKNRNLKYYLLDEVNE